MSAYTRFDTRSSSTLFLLPFPFPSVFFGGGRTVGPTTRLCRRLSAEAEGPEGRRREVSVPPLDPSDDARFPLLLFPIGVQGVCRVGPEARRCVPCWPEVRGTADGRSSSKTYAGTYIAVCCPLWALSASQGEHWKQHNTRMLLPRIGLIGSFVLRDGAAKRVCAGFLSGAIQHRSSPTSVAQPPFLQRTIARACSSVPRRSRAAARGFLAMSTTPGVETTKVVQGVRELCDSYDGFILDQFGVLHGESRPTSVATDVDVGVGVAPLSGTSRFAGWLPQTSTVGCDCPMAYWSTACQSCCCASTGRLSLLPSDYKCVGVHVAVELPTSPTRGSMRMFHARIRQRLCRG